MSDKRRAFEEKLDAQLREWNAQIALLKAKAGTAKAEAKVGYYAAIDTLQHKSDAAKERLQHLKSAPAEAWEDLKTGAERSWDEVKAAFRDAVSKFR